MVRTRNSTLSSATHTPLPDVIPSSVPQSQTAVETSAVAQKKSVRKSKSEEAPSENDGTVIGECKRCRKPFGRFLNEWIQVTGSYFLPALEGFTLTEGALQKHGRPRASASGTELEGCEVQPFDCQTSGCSELVALHCEQVPETKSFYSDKYFFKVQKLIQLRCESTNDLVKAVVVEERHQQQVQQQQQQQQPTLEEKRQKIGLGFASRQRDMASSVASPPLAPALQQAPTHPLPPIQPPQHHQQSETLSRHHSVTPTSSHQQSQPHPQQRSLAPPKPTATPQHHSPRDQNQQLPVQHHHSRAPSGSGYKDHYPSPLQRPRDVPTPTVNGLLHLNGTPNGAAYSPPQHQHPPTPMNLDIIHRLQSQVSVTTASVEEQRRRFDRVDEDGRRLRESWSADVHRIDRVLDQLTRDVHSMHAVMQEVRTEIRARPVQAVAAQPSLQDEALDAFARSIQEMRVKTGEVDDIKIQFELLKARLARIEHAHPASAPGVGPVGSHNPQREPPTQTMPAETHTHPVAPVPTHRHHSAESRSEPRPEIRPYVHATPHHVAPTRAFHPESAGHIQRDERHASQPPRVIQPPHAPHPPQGPNAPQPPPAHHQPHAPHAVVAPHHSQPLSQPLQAQAQSLGPHTPQAQPPAQPSGWVSVNPSNKRPNGVDARADSRDQPPSPKRAKLLPLEPRLIHGDEGRHMVMYEHVDADHGDKRAPPHEPHAREPPPPPPTQPQFIQYQSTNDAPPDESWRPESQRAHVHHGDGASPRRGRGGRGRGRKSMPPDAHQLATPDWEKPDWTGSQIGPDGYYHPVTPNGSKREDFVHHDTTDRAMFTPHHVSMDDPNIQDPYAHTKKTRTKPTRNADGVLIRKDGRPDMRSQSSAANLRKVHARKEEERVREIGNTPPSLGFAHDNGRSTEELSPATTPSDGAASNVNERHEEIMKQIFPKGVEKTQEARNAEKYFPAQHSPGSGPVLKAEATSESPIDRMDVELPKGKSTHAQQPNVDESMPDARSPIDDSVIPPTQSQTSPATQSQTLQGDNETPSTAK